MEVCLYDRLLLEELLLLTLVSLGLSWLAIRYGRVDKMVLGLENHRLAGVNLYKLTADSLWSSEWAEGYTH